VGAVERESVADGDECVVQAMTIADVVVRVVRGDDRGAQAAGELGEVAQAAGVAIDVMVLKLDEKAVAKVVAKLGSSFGGGGAFSE